MAQSDVTVFAKTDFRGEGRRFGIKTDDRRRHMYIIGKTGMGKSVFIENLVYNDIMAGKGVALVDPHGDTVEKIVSCIPDHRVNDVIYFNPADLSHPIAFNVLEKVDPKYRHLVASGIVGVFKKLWVDSWGPRLEYLLRNAILALLDYPDSTLLGVNRLMIDKDYRKKVVAKIKDPVVKAFWLDEYTKYNQSFMVEAIAPIQNKVGQFLSTSLIRNIVGQVRSTVSMRQVMDEGKILLLNLSKGRIGEDASAMLGAMLITKIQLAAMSRVDVLEEERRDFYLYVDEFQNFSTESFANILSEARKYRLNLVVAHQYIEQLDETVSAAIFGNVGTFICFRVGAADAEVLVKEFEPTFMEEDFVNLPKYHIYLKLMIDGVASEPFSAVTLPPVAKETDNADKVIRATRERYARRREEVEDHIAHWSGVETEEMLERLEAKQLAKKRQKLMDKKVDFLARMKETTAKPEPEKTAPKTDEPQKQVVEKKAAPEKEKNSAEEEFNIVVCDSCGQKTKINFTPDGVRPVFCKECLKEYRREQALAENRDKDKGDNEQPAKQKKKSKRNKKSGTNRDKTGGSRKGAAKEISLAEAISREPERFTGKQKPKPTESLDDQIEENYEDQTEAPIDKEEEIAREDLDSEIVI